MEYGRNYVGARYVPKFYENSDGTADWRAGVAYEPLTIVTYNGNSYTSKIPVPSNIGDPSSNPNHWASTGIYNQQVEEYRQEVIDTKNELEEEMSVIQSEIDMITNRRFIFVGDSYAEPSTGWVEKVCSLNGLTLGNNAFKVALGGTGFVGGSGLPSSEGLGWEYQLRQRSGSISGHNTITDIIVCGGANDLTPSEQGLVGPAISSFLTYCAGEYPNAKVSIGMIGWSTNVDALAKYPKVLEDYMNGAQRGKCAYITNSELAFHYSAQTTDGTHPNTTGVNLIARCISNYILCGSGTTEYNRDIEVGGTRSGLTVDANANTFNVYGGQHGRECYTRFNVDFVWTNKTINFSTNWQELFTLDNTFLIGSSNRYNAQTRNVLVLKSDNNYALLVAVVCVYNKKVWIKIPPQAGVNSMTIKELNLENVYLSADATGN